MEIVNNYSELINDINLIKKKEKKILSNYYQSIDKLEEYIIASKILKEKIEDTLFLFKQEHDFLRLYFFSPSIKCLSRSIDQLDIQNKSLVVTDLIGRSSEIGLLKDSFLRYNFTEYTELSRMSRIGENYNFVTDPRVQKVTLNESTDLFTILYTNFDRIAEQLPSLENIKNWIEKANVYCIKQNGIIVGFIIFEVIGYSSYLRYWYVDSNFRNKKFGSGLLNKFFELSISAKKHFFWVISNNKNAITRYTHYGFEIEDLFDCVLTNKNIKYETKNY